MRGDLPARINLRKNTDSVKQALCKREGPDHIRRFSNSHIKKGLLQNRPNKKMR